MTIVSIWFFAFVIGTILPFYILPRKCQPYVLLVASFGFFFLASDSPWTIVYLIASIFATWRASVIISKNFGTPKAKFAYWTGMFVNLGMLFALKYTNFVLRNAGAFYNLFSKSQECWRVYWPAALGISFYTLQVMGYLTDCYWGICKPQKNIAKVALFTSFFPQMVSGPISRYDQLSEQLFGAHKFEWENIRSGGIRMAVGLFKKLVLAENLNILVQYVFNAEEPFYGIVIILAIAAYVIQIYADFSGCMDIVIGTAECFGITLVENFNRPFSSRTIQEFWQRWHITLGHWLRDYIMYPLLRSKAWQKLTKTIKNRLGKKAAKTIPAYIAMLVLWFCMGLWHGGGWNYIFEGIWFWIVIVLGQICEPLFQKITSKFDTESKAWVLFQRARTAIIYAIGAVFFQTLSVRRSFEILKIALLPQYISLSLNSFWADVKALIWADSNKYFGPILACAVGFIGFVIFNCICHKSGSIAKKIERYPCMVQILVVVFIIYLTLIFGVYGPGYSASEFIYGGF